MRLKLFFGDLFYLYVKIRTFLVVNSEMVWLFICYKTKLKKKIFFFEKTFLFFTKYTLFAENYVFIWEKGFILKIFFTEKTSFREKDICENAKTICLI